MEACIYNEVLTAYHGRIEAVLAIIVDSSGSTPRETGAKMVIFKDGSIKGTIGGGKFEHQIIADARAAFQTKTPFMKSYDLLTDLKMECGGLATVYFEPILPKDRLIVFGGGHVAKAVCEIASLAGFYLVVIDDRPEWANLENFPAAGEILNQDMLEAAGTYRLTPADYVVIVTREHKLDKEILRSIIERPFFYLGMIGSVNKVKEVKAFILKSGVSEQRFALVHAPIGIQIQSKTPYEIAVSIVAQLIDERHKK